MADDATIDQINAARKELQAGSGVNTPAPASPPADDAAQIDAINAARKSIGVIAGATPPPEPIPFQTRSFTQDASDFGAGLMRGVGSVVLPAASGLSWLTSKLPTALQSPYARSSADISAENQALQAQFEKDHPSAFGTAGTIAGQTAITAPVLGAGGKLIGMAADAIPAVKSGLTTAGTWLENNVAPRLLQTGSRAVTGAGQGAGASVMTGNVDSKSLALAAAGGGALSVALPLAAEGASRVLGGTSSMTPQVAQFMKDAEQKYGINLRATQVEGGLPPSANIAHNVASGIPFSGVGSENAAVNKQWQDAVAKSAGIDNSSYQSHPYAEGSGPGGSYLPGEAPKPATPLPITPSNLKDAMDDTKLWLHTLEQTSATPNIAGQHIAANLQPIADTVNVIGGADAPALNKMFQGIDDAVQNGKVVNGQTVHSTFGDLLDQVDQAAKMTASPTVLKVLKETRDGIQDALQDHLAQLSPTSNISGHPLVLDGDLYHKFRAQAYNQSIIQDAMGGGTGLSPASLSQAVKNAPSLNADMPPGLKSQMVFGQGGLMANPTGVNIPGRELPDLARIGTAIGKPPDMLDKLLKVTRIGEFPAALGAIHGMMGAPLAHLPLTAAGQGLLSAGAYGTNKLLSSQWLANRLQANAGKGVAPWVDKTVAPSGVLGGNIANALQY